MNPLLHFLVALMVLGTWAARAAQPEQPQISWSTGPLEASIGTHASINLKAGYMVTDEAGTAAFLEATENPASGTELAVLAPTNLTWFCIFSFDDTGYVRDDEKDSLDSNAMLRSIKEATESANAERRRRGWSTMEILGWEQRPRYNTNTHHLEWAIRGKSEGQPVVNYSTRLLGRKGVMKVVLVTSPDELKEVLPVFQSVLNGYTFTRGNTYAEFKPGDRVAEYGLTALVVGGAAAVAVKSGFGKWLVKLLVIGGVAVLSFFRQLFRRS